MNPAGPPRQWVAPSFSSAAADERVGSTERNSFFADPDTDAVGFVLAGGQSSRMGRDKALLEFAGKPLVAHALSILEEAGIPAAIAGAPSPARASLEAFVPVIEDASPGLGPLSGICTALSATTARYAVFLPIDQPLLPPSLIVFLLRHARITGSAVTVPSVSGLRRLFPRFSTALHCRRSKTSSTRSATAVFPRFRRFQQPWASPSAASLSNCSPRPARFPIRWVCPR